MSSSTFRSVSASGHRALLLAGAWAAGTALPQRALRDWPAIVCALVLLAFVLSPRLPGARGFPADVPLLLMLATAASATHLACDPTPALLEAWRAQGVELGATPITLEGRLLDVETLPAGRAALVVRLTRFTVSGRRGRVPRAVIARLTFPVPENPSELRLRPGESLEITARIGPPRSFQNPGAFDYGAYLKAERIDLVGSVKSWRLIRVVPGHGRNLCGILPAVRRRVVSSLFRAAGPDGESTASFLSALLLGERQELPSDLEETLVEAGVFHIVALSGFNVALVVALLAAPLRALPLHPRARRGLLAISVTAYWAIARSSGSMARATLMALLYLGGGALHRRASGIGAMSSASVLLLLANPFWIQDAGFQLSLAATLGILMLAPGDGSRASTPSGGGESGRGAVVVRLLLRLIGASLRVSGAALAGTSLVTARHFQTLTPIALVSNVLAVPIASVLLVLGAAAGALACCAERLAGGLLALCQTLLRALVGLCGLCAAAPGGSVYVIPPRGALVLFGLVTVVAMGTGGRVVRRFAWVGFVVLVVVTLLAGRFDRPRGRLEVVLFDVGQGDSILVRFPGGTTMLVDAGGFARSQFDVGAKVVAPALRALGVLKLDLLAVTHAHRDHIGGARAVFRQFSPGAVWLGRMPPGEPAVEELRRLADQRLVPVVSPRRGVRLRIDSTIVDILNPGPGVARTGPASNNDSLVLRLTYGNRSVLLTGDLEGALESTLVREGRALSADVLKVGHHGSRTSTSPAFLDEVHPRLALISVGAGNPWGHPSADVLARLTAAGVTILTTERDGAVGASTDGASDWRVEIRGRDAPYGSITTGPGSAE